ncbi:hypothetical protein GCM10010191_54340 [Actinomadura vinacea]|uniref:Alpha/beta hydrolase n=1 Tax=Actinomadura vinacea TaxID=115336 RepID=A0ABN3JLP8_9ACTN
MKPALPAYAVQVRLGVPRLDLLGESYGTYLMAEYARRNVEQVKVKGNKAYIDREQGTLVWSEGQGYGFPRLTGAGRR